MKRNLFSILILTLAATGFAIPVNAETASADLQRYGLRDLTNGQTIISQNIEAHNGDEIEFSLRVVNSSTLSARDVQLQVYLPFGMRVVAGSIKVDGVILDSNVANGIVLGNIGAGGQRDIVFRAIPGSNLDRFYEIPAQISGNNIGTITKFATINVSPRTSASTPLPTPPGTPASTPTPSPGLTSTIPTPIVTTKIITKIVYVYAEKESVSIMKVGRNVTDKQQISSTNIDAKPGDELEFSIQITSSSNKVITNVVLKDTLPEQVDYIFNPTRTDQQIVSDQLFRKGFSLGNLQPKESRVVRYHVRVLEKEWFSTTETELKNVSEMRATNAHTATASASIFVKKDGGNFLGGVIAFSGFTLYLLIILGALAILFLTFWLQEKRKPRSQLTF